MSSIGQLLSDLAARDIRLRVENGRLGFSAPEGAMNAEIRQQLVAHKTALLEALTASNEQSQPPEIISEPDKAFDPFVLTPIQQAYWIGRSYPDSFELGGVSAHVYFEMDCPDLNVGRLTWAWNVLIRRHPMLRAVVDADGRQRVLPEVAPYEMELSDLSAAATSEIDQHIELVRSRLSHRVAPADVWPMFDVCATLLSDELVRLHVSFDGLSLDASSIMLLGREAWALYTSGRDELDALALTFRDYVIAEEKLRDSAEYQRSSEYWRKRLPTLPAAPDLPLASVSPHSEPPRFTRRIYNMPAREWSGVKARARRDAITPSSLVLAAFAQVLAQWSRSAHFTINLSLFNRKPLHPQVDAIVGDFTTLTLLEIDAAEKNIVELSRAIQARLWVDMDHRAVGGTEVLGMLRRNGEIDRAAMPIVFTSALSLDSVQDDATDLNPFGSIVFGITQTPQVLLDVLVVEHRGALCLAWDTVDSAFAPGLLDAMFDAYGKLLDHLASESALAVPFTPIRVNSVAPQAPTRPYSSELLHEAFYRQCLQAPDAIAIFSTQKVLRYAELASISMRTANVLSEHSLRIGEPVVVMMRKSWEQIAAVMAILAAGGAYVPVDAEWPEARRHAIIRKLGARLVIVETDALSEPSLPAEVLAIRLSRSDAGNDAWATLPKRSAAMDLAYVIFTSGSTGEPKGVMISHEAAVNTIEDINARRGITALDRVLALSSLSFDLSVYDIFGLLGAGGAVVIPDHESLRNPAHWLDLMREHTVTIWNSVPALMGMLTEFLSLESTPQTIALRVAMLSGDWVPLTLPPAIQRNFPACEVISLGGATEAAIWSIEYPVHEINPDWKSIPYGYSLTNQNVVVLGPDYEVRPLWAIGEIFISGRGVALGYWADIERTALSFVKHPKTGERLYRTGDLGRYRPDGAIEFLGRQDHQVKIDGFRIELGEIETVLKRYPGVSDVVVDAIGSDQTSKRLVAFLVPEVTSSEVRVFAESETLAYKLSGPGLRKDLVDRSSVRLSPVADPATRKATWLLRQSHREFQDQSIRFEDFSSLLDLLCAQTISGSPVPKYMYPSGGSLYPVQVYIHIKQGRITGLDEGIYYLDPIKRMLRLVSPAQGIQEIHGDYNRSFSESAGCEFFLVADPSVVAVQYPEYARDFCLIEAGAISQLLAEHASALGLGLCGIGAVDFDRVRPILGLNSNFIFLHGLVCGAIASDQSERWGMFGTEPDPRHAVDIQNYASTYLPAYMVPRQVVWIETIPLTSNGKVDRKALAAISVPPIPTERQSPIVKPIESDDVSQAFDDVIASCTESVLGYGAIDRTKNFLDIGADSLKIVRIRNLIISRIGCQIGILDFFRYPTVNLLAQRLNSIH